MDTDRLQDVLAFVQEFLIAPDFVSAIFSGVPRLANPDAYRRVQVRPIKLQGVDVIQWTCFTNTQSFTQNTPKNGFQDSLAKIVSIGFSGIHLETMQHSADVRFSKKGKLFISRKQVKTQETPVPRTHNHIKELPWPEGQANQFLERLGVLTSDGRVIAKMRSKFVQINEFLKQFLHSWKNLSGLPTDTPLQILDCGCGSSYLTLSLYTYLNDVLHIPAQVHGVDVNNSVIQKSIERSKRVNAQEITLTCERIRDLKIPADIVVALHACDTATDDAIATAIQCRAKMLLCAPCCHHHLHKELQTQVAGGLLQPMLRHGIFQQRFGDMLTDTFRVLLLKIHGYKVDVVEFVAAEHTARNIMIRAVQTESKANQQSIDEYHRMKADFGVHPYLEQLLNNRDFQATEI